jgi:hypothetical protein
VTGNVGKDGIQFDTEEVMKTLLGTAVVLAGLTFGVSNAFAHPSIGCGCSIIERNGNVATFNFPDLEHEEITLSERGNVNANCKVDLGTGQRKIFNNQNTGFSCDLTGSRGTITSTTEWQEVISANGQTTLQCHFHPATFSPR